MLNDQITLNKLLFIIFLLHLSFFFFYPRPTPSPPLNTHHQHPSFTVEQPPTLNTVTPPAPNTHHHQTPP
ncbi:hypothetical protein Hanom_Chr05g00395411 [Helianthus anomalus]